MVGLIQPIVGMSHQKKISKTHPSMFMAKAVCLSTSPANLKRFLIVFIIPGIVFLIVIKEDNFYPPLACYR